MNNNYRNNGRRGRVYSEAADKVSYPVVRDEYLPDIIKECAADKSAESKYLERLIQMCVDRSQQDILRQIQLDEIKHFKMLCEIYLKLVGSEPVLEERRKAASRNLLIEYEKSIFSKLQSFELYRKVSTGCTNADIRNLLGEIICDEQTHSIKFTYLYTKNKSF